MPQVLRTGVSVRCTVSQVLRTGVSVRCTVSTTTTDVQVRLYTMNRIPRISKACLEPYVIRLKCYVVGTFQRRLIILTKICTARLRAYNKNETWTTGTVYKGRKNKQHYSCQVEDNKNKENTKSNRVTRTGNLIILQRKASRKVTINRREERGEGVKQGLASCRLC